jgi:NAD(P)-dependent dehydrogenase (short-subunit alcohol dehydrogenase family)
VREISFEGQVAIVTGAGGGLGRAYALELARRGAAVVVNDLGGASDGTGADPRAADSTVAAIAQLGGLAVANYDSVASPAGGQAVIAAGIDRFGTVDIVINNAGNLRDATFANLDADAFTSVLDVHLRGAFHVTQPAFRIMKAKGYGRILFTSSAAGLFGNFGQSNYAAAKMGLVGLSNVVAIEGAKYGIKSNVIAPLASSRLTDEALGPLAETFNPDQVVPLAVYLVSASSTLTQQVYSAGAGRFARVFTALTPGWFSEGSGVPRVEDIETHLDEICAEAGYLVPGSVTEELESIIKRVPVS